MSSDLKFVSSSGADFDLGAPVDVDLSSTDEEGNVDYSGLYDFASFGKLMKAFYHVEGDANGDGVFNAKDIVAAMKFLVGCEIDGFSDYVADFNDDGRLNAKDVVAMMRSIVGAAEQEAMSYAEYAAAAVGDEVVIEAWIQDKQSRWDGKASVYLQDEDGGYFAYEMVCSEQDYEKLVPGTKIRVSGTKAMWPEENGEIEIASGCTFEFVGNAPSVIFDATDVTGLVGDDVLATMMNRRVSFKGLTVVAQSDGSAFAYKDAENKTDDLYFTAEIDGKKIDFCVEFYLRGNDSDVYKAVEALNVGDVIDVEAFLYWYNGANPHVVGITVK